MIDWLYSIGVRHFNWFDEIFVTFILFSISIAFLKNYIFEEYDGGNDKFISQREGYNTKSIQPREAERINNKLKS